MSTQTVTFTKSQFETLLKLVYLGNFMTSFSQIEDEAFEKFESLEKELFSKAESFGLEHFGGEEGPSIELEQDEEIVNILSDYDQHVFSTELIGFLTTKEIASHISQEEVEALSPEEGFSLFAHVQEQIASLLDEQGAHSIQLNQEIDVTVPASTGASVIDINKLQDMLNVTE